MGSRFLLMLFAVVAVGAVVYVALSGGGPPAVEDGELRPEAPPEEPILPPPVVPGEGNVPEIGVEEAPEAVADGTGALVVTVNDAEGAPVAGATVSAGAERGTTGADGGVRFEALPAGKPLPVRAEGADPDDVIDRRTVRVAKDSETAVTLVLRAGGSFSGTVLGPGGAPVPVAFRVSYRSSAVPGSWNVGRGARVTGSAGFPAGQGAFRVRGVAPGWYQATADAEGYVSGTSEPFEVKVGETTEGIEIVLSQGGSVTGLVTDRATGKPLEGVTVSLTTGDGPRLFTGARWVGTGSNSTRTDDQGVFRIGNAKPGTYRVLAQKKGYALGEVEDVVVAAGAVTAGVHVALGGGGTITGTVFGPDGKPQAEVSVIVQRVLPDFDIQGDFGMRVETDANGVYVAEHLEPGRYRVKLPRTSRGSSVVSIAFSGRADGEEKEEKPLGPDMVEVREGQTVTKDLRAEPRATVRGVVTDRSGKPSREQVQLSRVEEEEEKTTGFAPRISIPQMHRPNEKGEFEFGGLEPGTWRVSAGDASETVTVGPGEVREVKLVVAPARVEGIVTDESGKPVEGATVSLNRVRGEDEDIGAFFRNAGASGRTDANGRFVLTGVTSGRYSASARKGSAEGRSEEFDVPPGGTVKDVRVVLNSLVRLTVTVRDADGNPVENVWVIATSTGAGDSKNGRTSSAGVAVLYVLPGEHRVAAMQRGSGPESRKVEVRPGEPAEIEIRLE